MNFTEIANARESCRSYDASRAVEPEKVKAMLEAARLAPSACNGQPYHFTVCMGEVAKRVAAATMGMGMNAVGGAVGGVQQPTGVNSNPFIQTQQQAQQPQEDSYAKLTEMKKLLDAGVITQADFDAAKAKLLGI